MDNAPNTLEAKALRSAFAGTSKLVRGKARADLGAQGAHVEIRGGLEHEPGERGLLMLVINDANDESLAHALVSKGTLKRLLREFGHFKIIHNHSCDNFKHGGRG